MTSKGLQERILKTCHDFLESDENLYKEERNDAFYNKFKEFVKKGSTFDSLMQRGISEDLKK